MNSKAVKVRNNKTGWKVFFWFYVILTVAGITIIFFQADYKWYEALIQIPLYTLAITGLHGFAYNRKYLSSKIWLFTLFLLILSDLYDWSGLFFQPQEWIVPFNGLKLLIPFIVFGSLFIFLTILPILALYQYSLKSPQIWEQPSGTRPLS